MATAQALQNNGSVLSVASEFAPLIKTGGLADVTGALPHCLKGEGWDVRTLLPAYPGLADQLRDHKNVWSSDNLFGAKAEVLSGYLKNSDNDVQIMLLDAPHLYDRSGSIYLGADGRDWPDNAQRFAALSWVGAEICAKGTANGWHPNVLHAHDWQAGLAPTYLKTVFNTPVSSVMTIHNMAYQGIVPAKMLKELHLHSSGFIKDGFEYWGKISALKAGLTSADVITTVSPTYARELRNGEFGMGMEGVIRQREARVIGILNGVDLNIWNPQTDTLIWQNYSSADVAPKQENKRQLLNAFDLPQSERPLFVVVSRMTRQKGLDLLIEALPQLLKTGGSLAVLGSGDEDLEKAFQKAAEDFPDQVSIKIKYDEKLAHGMFAGGDVVLVPSRFEPCGLTQLYAMRYGALPLVARTGGLADTVIDANDAALRTAVATGVQFSPITAESLADAISRAAIIYDNKSVWNKLQKRAMEHPIGWGQSAKTYAALYKTLSR